MQSKKTEYSIWGLVIGATVGVLAAFGALNMTKKSIRIQMLVPALSICGIGFAAVGYSKGSAFGREVDIEIALGHDKTNTDMLQKGRVWMAKSEWTTKDNYTHTLITGQTDDKNLISQLNGETIMNHEITSGSKMNVSKFHRDARNYIFRQQKDTYK